MAICTGTTYVEEILKTECIGNSLSKINQYFKNLDLAVCELTNSLTTSFVGVVSYFPCTIAPAGWLALSGQQVLRADYSNLWTFAQSSGNIVTNTNWTTLSAYGAFSDGDGSTTFRLPDLRGHFLRSSGTHVDGTVAATFGIKQDSAVQTHTHSYAKPTAATNSQHVAPGNYNVVGHVSSISDQTGNPSTGTSTETRPDNIALLACIKY